MMPNQNQFSCFIIGEGTLPIQCAQQLLNRGYTLSGIISSDTSISNWAKEKSIPYIEPTDNLIEFLSQQPFDYLFSIVNKFVLSQEVLELPRQCAINYHDAPLPRYAGVNATSWALIHQEKTYGITWHVMTTLVDAGDILKQVIIDIADGETALTLNLKCYEAAIYAFGQLIEELLSGTAITTKQNLNKRTYFSRSKRLSAGGIISWKHSAHQLDALIRALDFGSYPNPLGRAKLIIDSNLFVVSKLEILGKLSEYAPGTITAIEPNFLIVSTASYDILLHQVLTINGQPLLISDLVEKFGLQVGYRFSDIDPDRGRQIEKFERSIANHEAFWVEKLATLELIRLPYAKRTVVYLDKKLYASARMSVPHKVINFLKEHHPEWNWGDFLETAFVAYLARISGTGCFDIGLKDVELQQKLVGLESLFASVIPCRVYINCEQSFEEVFEAFNKHVAFTKLNLTYAQDVGSRYPALRSLSQLGSQQLFSVIIERMEKLEDYQGESANEFTFITVLDEKECYWFYNTEVLDSDNIARMQEQFSVFLQGIITELNQRVTHLPLLSEQEQHRILVEWNDTDVDYPKDKCIHQLFEEQVERTPNNVAVVFEDQQLTYRELNEKANRLAHYLQKLGVGPEDLVGICVERSLDLGVVILGTLKAGGACVILDPTDPKESLVFLLEDTQLSVLLTQKQLLEEKQFLKEKSKYRINIICVDRISESFCQESSQTPFSEVTAENIAYITYTSGSTGKPKGVMTSHRALCSRQLSWQSTFQLTEADRLLLNVYRSLILHYLLIGPLLFGGRVIIARPDGHRDMTYLVQLIAKEKITGICVIPSLLRVLLQQEGLRNCKSLKKVFCGSEVLTKEVQEPFFINLSADLYNIYGLTETTFSSIWKCQPQSNAAFVPIGRPIANTKVYILDSYLQPIPVGILGELYIGGHGLAREYLNRPDLTAERFIPNPFSDSPSTFLYKTGDLGCHLADGNIKYLGRIDRQVKIRGFRIELREVETILGQHPAVEKTLVVAREDIPGEKRLVAYIVARDQQIPTFNQLRSFVAEKLPNHMIPSFFMFLEALPLMSDGKINHRLLPVPSQPRSEIEETFVPPRNDIEKVLSRIWGEVLKIEEVGLYDNFFVLGGDSLLGTQLISSVHKIFHVKLSVRSLFQTPTLIEMSQSIIKHQAKPGLTEKIAQVIQKIRNMSIEEMKDILQNKKGN